MLNVFRMNFLFIHIYIGTKEMSLLWRDVEKMYGNWRIWKFIGELTMLDCLWMQKNLAKFDCCWKIKDILLGPVDYVILKVHVTCYNYIENIFSFLPRTYSINAKWTPPLLFMIGPEIFEGNTLNKNSNSLVWSQYSTGSKFNVLGSSEI
jgi:hypothetical protein